MNETPSDNRDGVGDREELHAGARAAVVVCGEVPKPRCPVCKAFMQEAEVFCAACLEIMNMGI